MGLRINTNVASLAAQRSLGITKNNMDGNLRKLSSGERITRAADDAAGLAISEKLKAHIRGVRQAKRNSDDGVSLIQTAEGGLNEISNIVIRLRELAVQAASDTVGDTVEVEDWSNFKLEFTTIQRSIESGMIRSPQMLLLRVLPSQEKMWPLKKVLSYHSRSWIQLWYELTEHVQIWVPFRIDCNLQVIHLGLQTKTLVRPIHGSGM